MPTAARNQEVTLFASDARTATVDGASQDNPECRGGHFTIDVTAISATPSIIAKIQGWDPAASDWYDILVSTPITAVGKTVLKVYPGIPVQTGAKANDVLPKTWRVRMEHDDADSITYSVGANLVV